MFYFHPYQKILPDAKSGLKEILKSQKRMDQDNGVEMSG